MYGPKKLLESTVFFTLLGIKWLHYQFVVPVVQLWMDTVLGTGEEVLKAWIRETFTTTTRYVNGFFAYVVALFVDQSYYNSFRSSWRRTQAWQAWWQEDRQSTLNAFIATHSDSQRTTSKHNSGGKRSSNSPRKQRRQRRRWYSEWWHRLRIGVGRWSRVFFSYVGFGDGYAGVPDSPLRRMHRNGSDLFDRPSGWAVSESAKRRGLLEDIRMNCELAVSAAFDWLRRSLRWLTRMPQNSIPEGRRKRNIRSHVLPEKEENWEEMMAKPRSTRFRRRKSFSSWESSYNLWTAADVIKQAGYPLEEHTVTTSDGYVLQMERIPRAGCEDVVFFMHGILDTSMGWVSNGVTGSQAFAAYDMGMDVWLGNSRSNPPRVHVDPRKNQTAKYWTYSVNELGMEDCAAQIDHIHVVKMAERSANALGLASGPLTQPGDAKHFGKLKGMRQSQSTSALDDMFQRSAESTPAPQKIMSRVSQDEARSPKLRAQSAAPESSLQLQRAERPDLAEMRRSPANLPTSATLPLRGPLADASNRPTTLKHAHSSRSRQGHGGFGQRQGLTEQEDWVPRMPIANGNASLVAGVQLNSHAVDVPPSDQLLEEEPFFESSPSPEAAFPDDDSDTDRYEDAASSMPGSELGSPTDESPGKASISSPSTSLPAETWHQPGGKRAFFNRSTASLTPDRSSQDQSKSSRPKLETPTKETGPPEAEAARPWKRTESGSERIVSEDPYRLRAVGHSLGGAALLIYIVMCLRKRRPHHIHRLILLTPAGFLEKVPLIAWPPRIFLPIINKLITWRWPNSGTAVIIPSSLLRFVTFKLTVDLQKVPALQELTRAAVRLLMNGDASEWDRAMQMPHYNTRSMPAISMHTGMHLIQWIHSGRFELYDYGSAAANQEHYGCPRPIDIAANYGLLDCPVDILAGRADGIIAKENVLKHYEEMSRHKRGRGDIKVTYKEFDFGHLDFTFAFKEDLVYYVKSRLKLQ